MDDYVDLIRENGQTTIGYNHLVMAAMWNRWYQRSYYYDNSCQLLTSIQSAVGMWKKPDEVKQFEQWFYNAADKDRLAGYANFRNQYPQYDSLLLQIRSLISDFTSGMELLVMMPCQILVFVRLMLRVSIIIYAHRLR